MIRVRFSMLAFVILIVSAKAVPRTAPQKSRKLFPVKIKHREMRVGKNKAAVRRNKNPTIKNHSSIYAVIWIRYLAQKIEWLLCVRCYFFSFLKFLFCWLFSFNLYVTIMNAVTYFEVRQIQPAISKVKTFRLILPNEPARPQRPYAFKKHRPTSL